MDFDDGGGLTGFALQVELQVSPLRRTQGRSVPAEMTALCQQFNRMATALQRQRKISRGND